MLTTEEDVLYGADVITRRKEFELALLKAVTYVSEPLGFTIRHVNWTAHPSQTPGHAFAITAWHLLQEL